MESVSIGLYICFVLVLLLHGLVVGALTSWLANNKGYNSDLWFVLGFLFAEIALLALVGAVPKGERTIQERERERNRWKCPECGKFNLPDTFECEQCGYKLL